MKSNRVILLRSVTAAMKAKDLLSGHGIAVTVIKKTDGGGCRYGISLPPEREKEAVWAAIRHPETIPMTFSPLPYFLRGSFQVSPEARTFAAAHIDRAMNAMLDQGATTFYETPLGGDDFRKAGSLCHAWSAIHPYFYGAFTLGVEPLEPGFRTFRVKPWAGNFRSAAGEIPTPAGNIAVAWHRDDTGKIHLEIRHPAPLRMQCESYPECAVTSVTETVF